jgi:lysophospholipase L1-like esterase
MTQGAQGDYTWRYRIWDWFREQGIAATFVGPYLGTQPPTDPAPPAPPTLYGAPPALSSPIRTNGLYATDVSPNFQSNHFSVWGRAAAVDKGLIQDVVTNYPADLVLLMLGFNDMGWYYSDAPGTLDSVQTLVNNARAANPNLKFAIANVPMRTDLGRVDLPANTDLYNSLLKDAIPQWSTNQSPIALVELRENYSCELDSCPAGYDGLHPNAFGEYEIAYAFSLTLVNQFGIGSSPVAVPDFNAVPARPMPVPTNFVVQTSPGGILATWDPVFGAYSYDVQSRIEGITDWSTGSVNTNRYDGTWTGDGWVYDIQIRVSCGNYQKGDWTSIASATAHPQTAPGPLNVVVSSTATGFDITFDPPTGPYTDSIVEYVIWYFDKDTQCSWLEAAAFTSSPVHLDGLLPGHRYLVAPSTWNAAGGGFPEIVNSVTIGEGTPPAPSNFQLFPIDLTSLHMTWTGSSIDAGYNLWSRYINGGSALSMGGGNDGTCVDYYFLFPGIWTYEFCVSAYNGNAESGLSNCAIVPSPSPGFNPAPTCAAAPLHCPIPAAGSEGSPAPTTRQTGGPTGTPIGSGGSGGVTVVTVTTTGSDGQSTTYVATLGITTVTTTEPNGQSTTYVATLGT